VGYWRGCLFGARCKCAYVPVDVIVIHSFLQCEIQITFTFLVSAYMGSVGKRAIKNGCACVCAGMYKSIYFSTVI